MYNYRVYGMNVESEIALPELLTSNYKEYEYVDVNISYGTMPKEIVEKIEKGQYFSFNKDKTWFLINCVAKYYIHSGNNIIVEPFKDSNTQDVKAFLLGSAFGMLLLQRKTIAIHGGTIVIDGNAIVITGEQGMGKSTLTSALREKGFSFMADDVSVIGKRKDTKYVIHPGYPQQKLCRDAMEKMGYNVEAFERIDEGRDKYAIPVLKNFIKEPMPMAAIFEITMADCSNVEIEEITGIDKLKLLLNNIYRVEVTHYSGISPEYFKKCIDIAKVVPFFKIKRPNDKFSVEEQISVIEKVFENRNKEFAKVM